MKVTPHKPIDAPAGRRLLSCAGIGLVKLLDAGLPIVLQQLAADGRTFEFDLSEGDEGHITDFSL